MSASTLLDHEIDPNNPLGTEVYEQFEDLQQQNDTYIVGMWSFLVTEVMFFGALFLTYSLYRWKYQPYWYEISKMLDVKLGGLNTVILLTSSLTMALAVHFAQKGKRMPHLMMLLATVGCAFGFLVVKTFEYSHKFHLHLFPNAGFHWEEKLTGIPTPIASSFYSLYFAMTGLHGLHVIIGILIIGFLAFKVWRKHDSVNKDYIPTELVGLYWHFVDLVWIFLFPLFYLMPK